MRRTPALLALTVCAAVLAPAAPVLAHGGDSLDKVVMKDVLVADTVGLGDRMEFVANLPYAQTGEPAEQAGSDVEIARIGARDYAFAGTLRNGLQIVDVTNPRRPRLAAVYDCQVTQGDVQVFRQGHRVLATYTADSTFGAVGAASRCATDLGLDADAIGTVLLDVTDPTRPTSLGFAPVPLGSHNMSVHPGGRYLYNSNSDLITSTSPTITIFDISDPRAPRKVQDYPIPFVPTSLGSESHDITFTPDGTRAWSGALSQTLLLDTSDPERPQLLTQIVDPTIQVVHQADPFTLVRADGTERDLVVITDEQAGAAAGTNCPGGGLHFYDVTDELRPVKVGAWFIGRVQPSTATCTSHVLRVHPEQGLLTVAWYDQGVRVLDIAGLADYEPLVPVLGDVALGDGLGIREIGAFVFADANTWSFKTHAIRSDGSFFGYGNDLGRGFDVYRFTGLDRRVPPLVPVDLMPRPPRRVAQSSPLAGWWSGGDGPAAGLLALTLLGVAGGLARRATRGPAAA